MTVTFKKLTYESFEESVSEDLLPIFIDRYLPSWGKRYLYSPIHRFELEPNYEESYSCPECEIYSNYIVQVCKQCGDLSDLREKLELLCGVSNSKGICFLVQNDRLGEALIDLWK